MALKLEDLRARGITYFASGSNNAGEIRALAELGYDLGVAAPKVNDAAIYALVALRGSGISIFVDSGAFSEFEPGPELSWPRPISHEEWRERMDLYLFLAEQLGEQVYLVAPDRVADQAVTFERQAKWADAVRDMAEYGANILCPIQKGKLPLAKAEAVSRRVLAPVDIIPAIPMQHDSTPLPQLAEYLRASRPARVHLLGLGAKGRRLEQAIDAVTEASPRTRISLDSVLIASMVERKERVRPYTHAQDIERGQLDAFEGEDAGADWTEAWQYLDSWLDGRYRVEAARELGLRGAEREQFLASPLEWVHADEDRLYDPLVDLAVQHAWASYWDREHRTDELKRRALGRALRKDLPKEHDEQYMFEGARTTPAEWAGELAELRELLPDDPDWPYGRYVVSLAGVRRIVRALDALELWGRADDDAEGLPRWRTRRAVQRKRARIALEIACAPRERDGDGYLDLRARPVLLSL